MTFVKHQVCFGIEPEGQFRIRGFHSEMNVTGNELLFSDGCIGQEIEVVQSEVARNVQVCFPEAVHIIHIGMSAIVVGIPFAVIVG